MKNEKDDKLNLLEVITLKRKDFEMFNKVKLKKESSFLNEVKLESEQIAEWLQELADRRKETK